MESNLTVTIFSEEYRDLIKAKCQLDLMLGMLLEDADLAYNDKLHVNGIRAAELVQQFAPRAYELKAEELLAKREELAEIARRATEEEDAENIG